MTGRGQGTSSMRPGKVEFNFLRHYQLVPSIDVGKRNKNSNAIVSEANQVVGQLFGRSPGWQPGCLDRFSPGGCVRRMWGVWNTSLLAVNASAVNQDSEVFHPPIGMPFRLRPSWLGRCGVIPEFQQPRPIGPKKKESPNIMVC